MKGTPKETINQSDGVPKAPFIEQTRESDLITANLRASKSPRAGGIMGHGDLQSHLVRT